MARVKIVYAIQRMNLLPIFNKERTQRSIQLWNLAKAEREALPPRERAETRRRLIKVARQFGLQIKVETLPSTVHGSEWRTRAKTSCSSPREMDRIISTVL